MTDNRKWLPKPEIIISPKLWKTLLIFNSKSGIHDHREVEETVGKWLRQQPTTGNSDAAKTGTSCISGITTHSVEIPTADPAFSTMMNWQKCCREIATTTDNRKWQYVPFGRSFCYFRRLTLLSQSLGYARIRAYTRIRAQCWMPLKTFLIRSRSQWNFANIAHRSTVFHSFLINE